MVNKTTSFKKKGKGKKGNFKKNGKQVAAQVKKPKSGPKPETECFYCKGTGHWKRNCPKYLADKKDGKVNKGICDICRVIGATYANGWLIIVGANKTSPVPGNGMRRRHARRRILPRFGALREIGRAHV